MSLESLVSILLLIVGVYLIIGVFFAVYFVFKGATQIDNAAKGMSLGTKLLLLPASIAFWVILIKKIVRKGVDNGK